MKFGPQIFACLVVTWCGVLLCGCMGHGPGLVDEEKEPQFLIGRSRVNAMNFSGAIEAFEQALEMNPQSGAAHFELGWLYAEKEGDPAAAIYHYQKYLRLRPNANNAETIRQHIFRLKQELAKAVLPVPPTPELQRQLEQLVEEKRRLQAELEQLRQVMARGNPTPGNVGTPLVRSAPVPTPQPQASLRTAAAASSSAARSYRVQPGDTLIAIARRNNVSLDALTAANPGLNPRRLQVGDSIRLPSR